jgi:glycosyltransferase involved in cell wall biosynthesis
MARACAMYAGNAELRKRHGKAGRARILRDYDAKAHAKEIEDILVRVARSR